MKFHACMNTNQALKLTGYTKNELAEVAERFPFTARETEASLEIDIVEFCYDLRSMAIEQQMLVNFALSNFESEDILYKYEDVTYGINLLSVSVFPQSYAGVTDYISKFARLALVIDIGCWTTDIIPFRENRPDISNCNSLSEGTFNCMHKINEELRSLYNGEADESSQVQS